MLNIKKERLRKIQQKVDTHIPLSKAQLLHLLREANDLIEAQRIEIRDLKSKLNPPSGIILLGGGK